MIMSKKRTKCYRFAAIVLVVLFSLPVALVAWGGPNEAPGQIDSPGQTYNPGINDNPALTFDPRKFKPGDRALHPDFYRKHQKPIPDFVPDALAPYYDARDDQIVTSVKSQSSCGSCWAFASAGAMESHLLKLFPAFDPLTLDLSEQQQVSCNINQSGCCGGSSTAIMFWETKGPLLESCFPYEESGTSCPIQRTVLCDSQSCEELDYRVVNWHTVTPTPAGFKTSLVTDGPSYFRYDFYDDFYDFWIYGTSGEVYVNTGNNRLGGHAILLIGWDDSKGAYLCKNSWGEESGPNGDGTFWMAYSGHASDLAFQMANFNLESVGSCGNGECDAGETPCNCPDDCGPPPAEVCDDGIDNDCDNKTDCDDEDCNDDPGCLCGDGVCEPGLEDCNTCPEDCISGGESGVCGNGMCEPDTEDCLSCPSDCAGKQGGKPSKRFCCGGEAGCDDPRCTSDGFACGQLVEPYCCGDGECEGAETSCNCPDCEPPDAFETYCSDGVDNDCDGNVDCADGDCAGDLACPECGQKGDYCESRSDCCSNKCVRNQCK